MYKTHFGSFTKLQESVIMYMFVDPRYEWSIFSGPRIQTSAKPAFDWLEKNVTRGKLTLSTGKRDTPLSETLLA